MFSFSRPLNVPRRSQPRQREADVAKKELC